LLCSFHFSQPWLSPAVAATVLPSTISGVELPLSQTLQATLCEEPRRISLALLQLFRISRWSSRTSLVLSRTSTPVSGPSGFRPVTMLKVRGCTSLYSPATATLLPSSLNGFTTILAVTHSVAVIPLHWVPITTRITTLIKGISPTCKPSLRGGPFSC